MHFLLIFRSQPSGNCLYSSLSILLFGNKGYIDELRVLSCLWILLISVSIHVFYHYLKLLKKLKHFFTMSIKNSTIDSDLKNEEAVKFEAQTNCISIEWSSFLFGLSIVSVIKRKVCSHFPNY